MESNKENIVEAIQNLSAISEENAAEALSNLAEEMQRSISSIKY